MEVGSDGSATGGSNKDADSVFNSEINEFFVPPSNEIIATGGEDPAALPSESMADVSETTEALNSSAGTNRDCIATGGEDPAALPSKSMADVSETTEALNSSAGTNRGTVQASTFDSFPLIDDISIASPQPDIPLLDNLEIEALDLDESFDCMVVLEDDKLSLVDGALEAIQTSEAQLAPGLSRAEDAVLTATRDPAEGMAEISLEVATDVPTQESVDASALAPAGIAAAEVPVMKMEDLQPSEVLLPVDEHFSIGEGMAKILATPQVEAAVEMEITLGGTSSVVADEPLEGEHAQEEEPAVVNNEVSEHDIQSLKGQKVMKKFGKKNFLGDVVDYDPESKWFKIVYEDGDDEDMEVGEVKTLLVGTPPASAEKRAPSDKEADEESKKSSKKPKKSGIPSSAKETKGSGAKTIPKSPKSPRSRGKSAKKSRVSKKTQKGDAVPKSPGKSEAEDSDSPSFTTPVKSETKSEEESKAKSKTATPKSSKGGSARSLNLQSPTPQKVAKAKTTAESSGKKKGTKSPSKGTKGQETPKSPKSATKRKAEGKEEVNSTNKRSKKGVTEAKSVASGGEIGKAGGVHHVGKPVRKDFGGTLYDGIVVKFDKKTKYYKVKYDDGDQEDLELSELEPILVPDNSSTDDDTDEKPVKLSSLSTLMSQEDRVVT